MDINCKPVRIIYNVGELKNAFEAIKGEQFKLGRAGQSALSAAEKALNKLAYHNPEDYLSLPGILTNLETFLQYHKDGKCVGVPKALAYRLSSVDLD